MVVVAVVAAAAAGSNNKDIRINHTKAEDQQVAEAAEWDMDREDRILTPTTRDGRRRRGTTNLDISVTTTLQGSSFL